MPAEILDREKLERNERPTYELYQKSTEISHNNGATKIVLEEFDQRKKKIETVSTKPRKIADEEEAVYFDLLVLDTYYDLDEIIEKLFDTEFGSNKKQENRLEVLLKEEPIQEPGSKINVKSDKNKELKEGNEGKFNINNLDKIYDLGYCHQNRIRVKNNKICDEEKRNIYIEWMKRFRYASEDRGTSSDNSESPELNDEKTWVSEPREMKILQKEDKKCCLKRGEFKFNDSPELDREVIQNIRCPENGKILMSKVDDKSMNAAEMNNKIVDHLFDPVGKCL
ncbi:31397_t:CDS:2, partial [Gigaspora margarita]